MALVNGVFLRTFQKDDSITPELLKEQVFPGDEPSVDEITQMFQACVKIAVSAARNDLELSELESRLAQTSFSEMQQQALLRAWRLNRTKVHDALKKESQWNNALKDFTWRIDVKTKAMADTKQDLNEPTAIVQFAIGPYSTEDEAAQREGRFLDTDRVIRFEMGREKLTEVVYQINQIQAQISKLTSQE
jgi:hypothetical protein